MVLESNGPPRRAGRAAGTLRQTPALLCIVCTYVCLCLYLFYEFLRLCFGKWGGLLVLCVRLPRSCAFVHASVLVFFCVFICACVCLCVSAYVGVFMCLCVLRCIR
jgi:hypothetical protein